MYDFFSDAKTKPSQAMLESVLSAEFGDEQLDSDPTTDILCDRVANLLGKEAAVLLPSGTMCNAIAVNVHCQPGEEIICDRSSYIVTSEVGGPAAISGVMINAVDGERGIFSADQLVSAIRSNTRFAPNTRLVSVEQTTAQGGGAVWPLSSLQSIVSAAGDNGLATHLDGARLMNAVVASGTPAVKIVEGFDSCWLDFAKGLGAPIGAVLAGSRDFIDQAWRVKQRIGGAMHQSGVIAAMCLYGLDHNIERLKQDHALAKAIGDRLSNMALVDRVLPVETNIVIFDISASGPDAQTLVSEALKDNVMIGAMGPDRIRIVTHLDVDPAAGDLLLGSLEKLLNTSHK